MKREELAIILVDVLEELYSRGKIIKLDGHALEICDRDVYPNSESTEKAESKEELSEEVNEEENSDNMSKKPLESDEEDMQLESEEVSMKLLETIPKGVKQDLLRSAKTCNSNAIGISIAGGAPVVVSVCDIERSLLKKGGSDNRAEDTNNDYTLDEEISKEKEIEARSKSNFFYAVNSRLNDARFKNSYADEYRFKSLVKMSYLIPQRGASAIIYNKLAEKFSTKRGLIHIGNGITMHYIKDDNFVVSINKIAFEKGFIDVNLDVCDNKCTLSAEEVEAVLMKMCIRDM